MPNHLIHENSPYLLQHADNPVEWYPWSSAALEKARREGKPIFLSIGYAACHWCHVMAHESFEDPATAALMNTHFINIKVDREERPDLDDIYMNSVVAMTGQGGWPMSVFLTPEGQPFFGGTYFPPERRYHMPAFREVLTGIAQAWRENREGIIQSGNTLTEHLKQTLQPALKGGPEFLRKDSLNQAVSNLETNYDWEDGGWGQAPKFPQPMVIEFLLCQAVKGTTRAVDMALHTLRQMALGGMYDVVGGGFSRYSTDTHWLIPHFEKMLYDNAQLASVYLHAFQLTKDAFFREICEETLDFVARELRHPMGGFYSSLDADSEGEEGKFYVWGYDEVRDLIDNQKEFDFIQSAYTLSENGNFEGSNVLQQRLSNQELADRFQITPEQVSARLKHVKSRLFEIRQNRIRPGTDDKVLVSWNGLMMGAFAEAARYLGRTDYLQIARENANFLLNSLYTQQGLLRSWREGSARHMGYLEDYAALILGLLALYQADLDIGWFQHARLLTEEMLQRFNDPDGGFFDTAAEHETLITRPKNVQDNAVPSGNALAALALLKMAAFTGKEEWRHLAEKMLGAMQETAARYPSGFGQWLISLDFAIGPVYEVAVVGEPSPERKALEQALSNRFNPHILTAVSTLPLPKDAPELLLERSLVRGKPTAYVCTNFVCKKPVNSADEMLLLLEN